MDKSSSSPSSPSPPSSVSGLPTLTLTETLSQQQEQLKLYQSLISTLEQSHRDSQHQYPHLSQSLHQHTETLKVLKQDLSDVFQRIRRLKTEFQKEYPEVFDYVQSLHVDELDE